LWAPLSRTPPSLTPAHSQSHQARLSSRRRTRVAPGSRCWQEVHSRAKKTPAPHHHHAFAVGCSALTHVAPLWSRACGRLPHVHVMNAHHKESPNPLLGPGHSVRLQKQARTQAPHKWVAALQTRHSACDMCDMCNTNNLQPQTHARAPKHPLAKRARSESTQDLHARMCKHVP
jgi:hypothetical protein